MSRKRKELAIPPELVERTREALAEVDRTRERLDRVLAGTPSRPERRAAHAELRHAFTRADELLREATRIAKHHSRSEWMQWRHRLSRLDTARQIHLFAERDDCGVLPICSVRAIDTGMSGPDIGDLQHGHSREPGAPATYGLDLERVLDEVMAPPPPAVAAPADHPTAPTTPPRLPVEDRPTADQAA